MTIVEIILLVIAYSLIIVTIFLEVICYKRNLETIETIVFTISLLLLIIALTVSPLLAELNTVNTPNVLTLLAMILVALTTPLNILEERQFRVWPVAKQILIGISIFLAIATATAHFIALLHYIQYVVIVFLGISVVLSMILIRTTKPHQRIRHREKTERIFAIAFIILVPLSLVGNYAFENSYTQLTIGFTIPLVFILLAGSKFFDDLQRLSLLNPTLEPKEQHFKNYALSDREREVALLLVKGMTYNEIAEALFISVPTVKTHTSNIYRKFGVKNRTELTTLLIN
jgi:DNA-binding CsgD family transcriptional regulator